MLFYPSFTKCLIDCSQSTLLALCPIMTSTCGCLQLSKAASPSILFLNTLLSSSWLNYHTYADDSYPFSLLSFIPGSPNWLLEISNWISHKQNCLSFPRQPPIFHTSLFLSKASPSFQSSRFIILDCLLSRTPHIQSFATSCHSCLQSLTSELFS